MRALVVGGGSWGTAFSGVLARAGHSVELACRDYEAVAELASRRENSRYLPGVRIENGVRPMLLDLARQSPRRRADRPRAAGGGLRRDRGRRSAAARRRS